MKTEATVWTKGALMICTKCATRQKRTDAKNWTAEWAENTKLTMKKDLKQRGLAKDLRVMTCSCLGLCPDDEQAVMFLKKSGNEEKSHNLVFDPEQEPQALQEFADKFLQNN